MVSIVVLSLGLLGLAGLQAVSLKTSANAHLRSQSVILANDMLDRIRANSENIGSYKLTMSASAPANQATIAEKDISQWLANVAASLPGGDGSISVAGTTVTVTVEWVERTLNGEVYATQDYDLTTRI
jgi:type IV pilus assembly protein PilV